MLICVSIFLTIACDRQWSVFIFVNLGFSAEVCFQMYFINKDIIIVIIFSSTSVFSSLCLLTCSFLPGTSEFYVGTFQAEAGQRLGVNTQLILILFNQTSAI